MPSVQIIRNSPSGPRVEVVVLPPEPRDPTLFLNQEGEWVVPAGGGGGTLQSAWTAGPNITGDGTATTWDFATGALDIDAASVNIDATEPGGNAFLNSQTAAAVLTGEVAQVIARGFDLTLESQAGAVDIDAENSVTVDANGPGANVILNSQTAAAVLTGEVAQVIARGFDLTLESQSGAVDIDAETGVNIDANGIGANVVIQAAASAVLRGDNAQLIATGASGALAAALTGPLTLTGDTSGTFDVGNGPLNLSAATTGSFETDLALLLRSASAGLDLDGETGVTIDANGAIDITANGAPATLRALGAGDASLLAAGTGDVVLEAVGGAIDIDSANGINAQTNGAIELTAINAPANLRAVGTGTASVVGSGPQVAVGTQLAISDGGSFGTAGQVLTADGAGFATWQAGGGGGNPRIIPLWAALNGNASATDGLLQMVNVTSGNPGGIMEQTSAAGQWANGDANPFPLPACTLNRAVLTYCHAATGVGTTDPTMSCLFELFVEQYSTRALAGALDFQVTNADIFNNLSSNQFSEGIVLNGLGIAIAEGQSVGLQFTSQGASSAAISALGGFSVYMEFELP